MWYKKFTLLYISQIITEIFVANRYEVQFLWGCAQLKKKNLLCVL